MGGGKTHSMIALGLLARDASFRRDNSGSFTHTLEIRAQTKNVGYFIWRFPNADR